uniref:Uncharacterized protein n=1 Tax=Archaeoglobus fulgidus TaxID=2234 RepID=A0A7J2TJK8_ARCFL
MFQLLLWISLLISILAISMIFFNLEAVAYFLILPLFAFLYSILLSLAKKASKYPRKIVARISATLYVLGFFWLVFSASVLILSAVFYHSAYSRGMLRLLHSIIFLGFVILGLSVISILIARKIEKERKDF